MDAVREQAENFAYLKILGEADVSLEMLERLPAYEECRDLEARLKAQGALTFDRIFSQPTGYYMMRCFLEADYAVDKAVFIKDIEAYKRMRFESARRKIAKLLYQRFVAYDNEQEGVFEKGSSVFQILQAQKNRAISVNGNFEKRDSSGSYRARVGSAFEEKSGGYERSGDKSLTKEKSLRLSKYEKSVDESRYYEKSLNRASMNSQSHDISLPSSTLVGLDTRDSSTLSIGFANNPIGVYGASVKKVAEKVNKNQAPRDLFDEVARDVMTDLKLDVFPRFTHSLFYQRFIRTKAIEAQKVRITDFESFRVLGRGGFGVVQACRKKNCGAIYAMKCINKKLVKDKGALDNILEERNVLSMLKSRFVTNLKYALQDEENLYLVMDLMIGGDLKFHLANVGRFTEERARFCAAEVLLGLEHIHHASVIYRDVKLENVLLDHNGHCRISDLGLAVVTKVNMKGYAGTPGYTAPEMVRNSLYGRCADFFSFGVLVYRMLAGKKPFAGKSERDLDRAVLYQKPAFPRELFSSSAASLLSGLLSKRAATRLGANGIEEIKHHPFFDSIDWGLLEAGYIDPPFVPNKFDVNALSLKDIGHFDQAKFRHVKLDERFKERLRNFEFVSVLALQEEMLSVLQKADANKNFEKFPLRIESANNPTIKATKCCTVM